MVKYIQQLRKSLLLDQKRKINPYQKLLKDELILRDFLATDRTILANERTFLAYIRTSITVFVGGITITHLFKTPTLEIVGVALIIIAGAVFIHGFNTYRMVKETISLVKDKMGLSIEAKSLEEVSLQN